MLKAGWRAVGGIREVVILSGRIGIVLLEVTCEQRAGSKGASHAALLRKTVSGRGDSPCKSLEVGTTPGAFDEQQGGQCVWLGVREGDMQEMRS